MLSNQIRYKLTQGTMEHSKGKGKKHEIQKRGPSQLRLALNKPQAYEKTRQTKNSESNNTHAFLFYFLQFKIIVRFNV